VFKKIKIWLSAALAVIVLALCAYSALKFAGSSDLTSSLPMPDESRPYAIFASDNTSYPEALTALLTEGSYAQFSEGTSRNTVLALAAAAQKSAVLVEDDINDFVEIYAALRFTRGEMKQLRKGEVPESWNTKLKSPRIEAGKEKDTWILHTDGVTDPVYFKADRRRILIAGDIEPFKRELAVEEGSEKKASIKWEVEKKWPGHAEICDGGRLFAKDGTKDETPLKLITAWHSLEQKNPSDPSGEVRWKIDGLDNRVDQSTLDALKPTEWDLGKVIIPNPMLLTMGLNIPGLRGSAEDWPFPLSSIASVGQSMKLSDSTIRTLLSNKLVVSLGGQNHLLWFTLPGFMVQLSGEEKMLREVVSAFWDKLFFGAAPKAIQGFDYGGTASVPFSAIAAGKGGTALLGLVSPESVSVGNKIWTFLNNGEKAIGWLVADLPRIGGALGEMTKMNSFTSGSEGMAGTDTGEDSSGGTPEEEQVGKLKDENQQTAGQFTPFNQNITDSFSKVLARLGRVLIVWGEPDSGYINWYKTQKQK
jgi:hypothetical protein